MCDATHQSLFGIAFVKPPFGSNMPHALSCSNVLKNQRNNMYPSAALFPRRQMPKIAAKPFKPPFGPSRSIRSMHGHRPPNAHEFRHVGNEQTPIISRRVPVKPSGGGRVITPILSAMFYYHQRKRANDLPLSNFNISHVFNLSRIKFSRKSMPRL